MKRILVGLPIVLAACAAEGTGIEPQATPAEADFSDINVTAIAQCVRQNATESEMLLINQGGELAESATLEVLQRPSTGDCLAASDTGLERAS